MSVIFCLQAQVSESLGISADGMLMSMMLVLTGFSLLMSVSNGSNLFFIFLPSSLTGFNLLFGSICPSLSSGCLLCCLF